MESQATRKSVIAALIVTALVAFSLLMLPAPALADDGLAAAESNGLEAQASTVSGKWGTCKWVLNGKGLLVVYPGTGKVQRNQWGTISPWREYYDRITRIEFRQKDGKKVVAPKDCSRLFLGLGSMKSIDLSGLDTSKTTNMESMFGNCGSLKSVDLSKLDTSKVTSMRYMFNMCPSLKSVNLSGLDTSRVTYMGDMFSNCTSLRSLDMSSLNTSRTTEMGYMFTGCTSLKSINLPLNTSRVDNMFSMFMNCSSLKTIYAPTKWHAAEPEQSAYMFSGCTSLKGGNGTRYDETKTDSTYARIDKQNKPGYFTSSAKK